ncbi:hypothetical protein Zm00014a_000269 [Zea mays]|jgi:hypothetical protein|uniref:Uncharacterized protein n=2 Tax=Zea mays TaxID=4577 RepID=A0A3L6EYE7_MAIZE|nr:hypothetical protein Zm00014a_000270 [Zea mays]PWZ29080.1 hypothetical protein Zm00014a_000269 [Zea mays]
MAGRCGVDPIPAAGRLGQREGREGAMSTWARRRAGARRGHDSAQQGIPGEQRHGKVEVSIGSRGSSKAQRKEGLGKGETAMDGKAPAPHCCVQAIEKGLGAELPAAAVGHQGEDGVVGWGSLRSRRERGWGEKGTSTSMAGGERKRS